MTDNIDTYARDTFRLQPNQLSSEQKDKINTVKTYVMNMEKILVNCIGFDTVANANALNMCMSKLQEMVFWASYHLSAPQKWHDVLPMPILNEQVVNKPLSVEADV